VAARTALKATVETTVRTELKMTPKLRRMLLERLQESVTLNAEAKRIAERKKRIGAEVEELMAKEKLTGALCDGFEFEGHQVKLVAGMSTKIDKKKMIAAGLDPEDFTTTTPKAAYVRIAKKGERGGDDD
jgi:hypothetical protein